MGHPVINKTMGTRAITNKGGSSYLSDGGRGLSNKGGNGYMSDGSRAVANKSGVLGSFKKGGKVKKTGTYKLHKGEVVVPKKSKGMKMLKKAMGM